MQPSCLSFRTAARVVLRPTFLLVLAVSTGLAASAPDPAERLQQRLEAPPGSGALIVADQGLLCVEGLKRFYAGRDHALAWSKKGRPTGDADSLLAALSVAHREGLNPADYHLEAAAQLRARLKKRRSAIKAAAREAALTDLDLLLTDAFLLYGTHCLSGRLDPESIDPEWSASRRGGDMVAVLAEALSTGSVGPALRGQLPPQPGYGQLRAALASLRILDQNGGWPPVPAGPKLQLGDAGPRVAALAARLRASGDLAAADAGEAATAPLDKTFDKKLAATVRRFQRRHGLDADGVVGPATLAALNVPVQERIAQVRVNLERWRWLPQDLGHQHVLVNIADQRLQAITDGYPTLQMAVIVGLSYRRTPVFSGLITHLVFSPFWDVPPSLAVQDVLPELRADPGRLVRLGLQVFQWGKGKQEIDPLQVDWNRVSADTFPYRLRQKPGPQNPLGGVKFMFPNKYYIYLHDTPARGLFTRTVRTFSSGCIRVERPVDLAQDLLSDVPQWTRKTIREAMTSGQEQTVYLKTPRPVHLQYWTAWVDGGGAVHFRSDIYGRDEPVLTALDAPSPSSP